jgi:two-component system chemotaxis sensor kinase CheA
MELDLFALFLSLGEMRVADARSAIAEAAHRPLDVARLAGALVPLAVDAALLGAEGVFALAKALTEVDPAAPPLAAMELAIDRLEAAVRSLGDGDASGARADENALREAATSLAATPRAVPAATSSAPSAPATTSGGDDVWVPTLPEDLVGAFLDECQERIESLAGRILVIEQAGAGAAGGEEVRALFRDLHTLKGSSGFAGLGRLHRLAHAAEDLVARVRDGTAAGDRATIDVLLAATDRFRAIVERASARAAIDVPVDDVIARLRNPAAPPTAPAPSEPLRGARTEAPSPAAAAATSAHSTLRVDFERVDQLQNFVNELVLARARLVTATAEQPGLGREIARVRRELIAMARAHDDAPEAPQLAELAESLGRLSRVTDEAGGELEGALATLGAAVGQLRERVMKLRMVPIARLFTKHQRTVRELGQALGKRVVLELVGQETELDKVLVEALEDPLVHLVRNAVDHGIESPEKRRAAGKPDVGTIVLAARQRGGSIVIELRDDGAGIDVERVKQKAIEKGVIDAREAATLDDRGARELIFRPGFSTADAVTDVSGRGVGMDVVRASVAALKGSIEVRSELGLGSTFELRLPLTLAVAQVLLLHVGGEEVALPVDAVVRALAVGAGDGEHGAVIEEVGGRPCLVERDGDEVAYVPIIDLAATLGLDDVPDSERREVGRDGHGHLVIVHAGAGGLDRVALRCGGHAGRQEVVVKPLGPLLSRAPCVAGASLIGDRVVLLLDLVAIVRQGLETTPRANERISPRRAGADPVDRERATRAKATILLAEDADLVREALRAALERAGYRVLAARDGEEALAIAEREPFDLLSTDVMMPKLDGYGLVRAVRKLPLHKKTPIVMVTSRDQRVDVLKGYDAGADAYVTKPADVAALFRIVEELLGKRRPS